MSIADQITRLQGVKADIIEAIKGKGVDVPSGAMLGNCPDLIGRIRGGSGGPLMIDGLPYRTVIMPDGREWMAENLQAAQGTATFYLNNEKSYGRSDSNFGRLYLGEEARAVADRVPGWHLPSKDEWESLFTACGSEYMKKLRAKAQWPSGYEGSDDYGFTFFASGRLRVGIAYESANQTAYFWSDTGDSSHMYAGTMNYQFYPVSWFNHNLVDTVSTKVAYPVRLIKDA